MKYIITCWGGVGYEPLAKKLEQDLRSKVKIGKITFPARKKKLDTNYNISKLFEENSISFGELSAKDMHHALIKSSTSNRLKIVNVVSHPVERVDCLNDNIKTLLQSDEFRVVDLLEELSDNEYCAFLFKKHKSKYNAIEQKDLVAFISSLDLLRNDLNDFNLSVNNFDCTLLLKNKEYYKRFLEFLNGKNTKKTVLNDKLFNNSIQKIYSSWEPWQQESFDDFVFKNNSLSSAYKLFGYYRDSLIEKYNNKENVFISIQLNSNRPAIFSQFIENIEQTADFPEQIEVLVNIDTGDALMKDCIQEKIKNSKLKISYITTKLENGFFDLWKPLNKLYKLTDKNAYFVTNLFDEMRFATNGWDNILREYINYYPDGYFRLRCSQFKHRNYFDLWECGFAPDSIAFYTRNWLDVGGDWNPCFGPDSFQQCVAYYLCKDDHFSSESVNRDIAIPNIRILGEGASIGLDEEDSRKRGAGHLKTWFKLFAAKNQTEAKKRAMLIKANIINQTRYSLYKVEDVCLQKEVCLILEKKILENLSYKISRLNNLRLNFTRRLNFPYFCSGGRKASVSFIRSIAGIIYNQFRIYVITSKVKQLISIHKDFLNRVLYFLHDKKPLGLSKEFRRINKISRKIKKSKVTSEKELLLFQLEEQLKIVSGKITGEKEN
ncbi:MAG: hypothetical protein RLN62_05875 [Rickettsiales bacterium]